jgi:type I restriction enzyme S subunit
MTELPAGWEAAELDEINDPERPICYGILMPGPDLPEGIPYVKVRNIRSDKVLVDEVHRTSVEIESKFARSRLRVGDVLVSIRGTYGRAASVPPELDGGNITQDTARVAPVGAKAAYVRLFMQSPAAQNYFKAVARGVAVKGVNIGDLRKLPVPVAPAAEQDRIVLAVEEAFSKLSVGDAGLRTAGQLLGRMREAILEAALTGRLVPQDPADTSAAKVLAEVGTEPVLPEGVPPIPETWSWALLGAVSDVVGGVTKDSKKQDDPTFVDRPYLRVANVQRGYLDLGTVTSIRVPPEKAAKLELRPGDVLFNEGGDRDKLGRGWVWEGQVESCIHQNHVFRARMVEGIEPKLVSLWGNTFGRRWFEGHGKQTTNLASINMKTLKSFPIPVAPAGLEVSAALRRSVLKAAFEGRLVPQDPTDEPASVLLERIRAERAANPAQKKRRARATA